LRPRTFCGLLVKRRIVDTPRFNEHLSSQVVVADVGREADLLVGFHRVEALVLDGRKCEAC